MRRLAVTTLVAALGSTGSATADDFGQAPSDVRATLEGTSAHITADYRIHTSDPATLSTTSVALPLPRGGVVVGATLTYRGVAHHMALDSATRVDELFSAAFADDAAQRPDAWVAKITNATMGGGINMVNLDIAAPLATEVLLTMEIVAPTCFFDDKRYVRAPIAWHGPARGAAMSARGKRTCASTEDGTGGDGSDAAWLAFPAPQAARRPSGDRVLVTSARLAVDHDLHLARTELALAAELADVPRDLATVILVDESRSMTNAARRSQRETVLGYLRAAPASRVQVLAFSRRTRALLPAWMVASAARPRLERELSTLAPRNGSNFDDGLSAAGRLLAATRGTRRVLLVTDEAMASRLAANPQDLARRVPEGTIINIVVTNGRGDVDDAGNAILSRNDDARLEPLAAATTGFATSLGDLEPARSTPVDASMLVRPTSLDHLRPTGLGWTDLGFETRQTLASASCEDSLPAGQACVWWTRGSKGAGPIQIEGLLWNRRVVRLVRPLGDPQRSIARELVGTSTTLRASDDPDRHNADAEARLAARIDALALAVTNTTSLFVRWGGSAMYAGGILGGGFGGVGRGGVIDGIGSGGDPRREAQVIDLAPQLRPLVQHCNAGAVRIGIELELTFQEIVDVAVSLSPDPGVAGDTLRRCIEDAVWDFAPVLPSNESFRTLHVAL